MTYTSEIVNMVVITSLVLDSAHMVAEAETVWSADFRSVFRESINLEKAVYPHVLA